MSKSKHFITKTRADHLITCMKEEKSKKHTPFGAIPDGFMLPVQDIRKLLKSKKAAHFVVQFGLKIIAKEGEVIEKLAPILCVADKDYNIIQRHELRSAAADQKINIGDDDDKDDDGGGYLDEATEYPPQVNPPDEP